MKKFTEDLERKEKKIFFVLTMIWHSGGNVKRKFGIFKNIYNRKIPHRQCR